MNDRPLFLQTWQQRFNDTVGTLSIFRSDTSKTALNIYRQFAIPLTRLMDYMWRSLSTGVTLLVKEAGQQVVDNLLTGPRMFEILQLDQLKTLPYLDEVSRLKARPYKDFNDLHMPKFMRRLTRHDFGDNMKAFSDLFTSDGEELLARTGGGKDWHYQNQPLRAEDPLAQHIHYTLGFRSLIHELALIHPYSERRLPYMPNVTHAETKQAVATIKGTLSLLDDLKLTHFMNRGRMVLDDVANGRYSQQRGIDTHRLNKDLTRLINPSEKKALTPVQEVAKLLTGKSMLSFEFANPNDKAAKVRFGEFLNRTFVESYSVGDDDRTFLKKLITQLDSGTLDYKGKPMAVDFSKGRKWLGLSAQTPVDAVLDRLLPQLDGFTEIFGSLQTVGNHLTSAGQLAQAGKEALAKFDHHLLTMASQMTHLPHDHHATLANVLEAGSQSPLYRLVSDGIRSDMKCAALKLTSDAARMPSIALGVIPSVAVGGFLWSYLDNHIIQPYQSGVVAEKGDVRGATATMGAGLLAGFVTYRKLMASSRLNFLMANHEPYQFWAAASASTMVATVAAVGLTKLVMKLKPDVYAQPVAPPNVPTPLAQAAPLAQPRVAPLKVAQTGAYPPVSPWATPPFSPISRV
jgi:hypothetical protein